MVGFTPRRSPPPSTGGPSVTRTVLNAAFRYKGVMPQPLTPRQLAVLHWVAGGCLPGVWPDDTHKHTARALQARGLVTVRRPNGVWHAELLPGGQHYLAHGDYADAAPTSKTAQPVSTAKTSTQRHGGSRTIAAPRPATRPSRIPPAISLSPAEALVDRIRAAGGTLVVETTTEQECLRLDTQIRSIRRFHKLPQGQQLIVSQPNWRRRELSIVPLPDWMSDTPIPAPIPTQLRHPHPAVATLRDGAPR